MPRDHVHRSFAAAAAVTLSLAALAARGAAAAEPAQASARSCRDTLSVAVDQFRHARLVEAKETPGGLTARVEIDGAEADLLAAASAFKDGLDRFGFAVTTMATQPLRRERATSVLPIDLSLSCPAAGASGRPGAPQASAPSALSLRCPEPGTDLAAALRAAVAARGAASPRLDLQITRDGGEIHVGGAVETVAASQDLAAALEACPAFSKVELRSVSAEGLGRYTVDIVATIASR